MSFFKYSVFSTLLSTFLLAFHTCYAAALANNSSLPIIDLGYVKQQATYVTQSGNYYVFKNIRFAAPPLGELRLQKPQQPTNESGISDGSQFTDSQCHQYLGPQFYGEIPGVPEDGIDLGSEDCLFLDVWVPVSVKTTDRVPVLGWWFPGGYYQGAKDWTVGGDSIFGTPEPLLSSSSKPFIFVAANYRLGAFGWLAPNNGEITANLGLYDVRFAMEWVEKYIQLFGGDKDRFTVMGDSAGSGSIGHTLTAYGGTKAPPPFQQVILQSAVWDTEGPSRAGRDKVYELFKSSANCTTLACLRNAPTEVLKKANADIDQAILSNSPDLGVGVGPVVDGDYVPDYVPNLLTSGKAHKIKSIVVSNTRWEGRAFVGAVNETFLDSTLRYMFPNSTNATIEAIEKLYPSDGTTLAEYDRTVDFQTDELAACHSRWFADAYSSAPSTGHSSLGNSYRYIYDILPALHGNDVEADFFDNTTYAPHKNWIVNFIMTGNPGAEFVEYGTKREATWFNDTAPVLAPGNDPWAVGDKVADARCNFLLERKQFV